MKTLIALCALPIFTLSQVLAQTSDKKLIVTGRKWHSPLAKDIQPTEIIYHSEIEGRLLVNPLEILSGRSGLQYSQNGAGSGNASLYLRGMDAGQTLILLDGVELNDGLSIDRSVNLAQLNINNIDTIEIIKGSQSVLYGPQAIGGVIHIKTKKQYKRPHINGQLSLIGGNYQYGQQGLGLNYNDGQTQINGHYSRTGEEGVSAARPESFEAVEKDSYETQAADISIRRELSPSSAILWKSHYLIHQFKFDDWGPRDSLIPEGKNTHFNNLLEWEKGLNELWESKLSLSSAVNKREIKTTTSQSFYTGKNIHLKFKNEIQLPANHQLWLQSFYLQEKGEEKYTFPQKSLEQWGQAINLLGDQNNFFYSIGSRIEKHQTYGNFLSYQASLGGYSQKMQLRMKYNWGTGHRSPSLYQLYSTDKDFVTGQEIGNPTLLPERSHSHNLELIKGFKQFGHLKVSLFFIQLKNLIEYHSSYLNGGRGQSYGHEIELKLTPHKRLSFSSNYTYTLARKESGAYLLGRAKYLAGLVSRFSLNDRINIGHEIYYKGRRQFSNGTLAGHTLHHLFFNQSLSLDFSLFSRVHNLLNKKYEDVKGFGTKGRQFLLGCKKQF